MGRAMMATLIMEAIAFGLALPVMIQLGDVPATTAGLTVGGVALLCLAAGGLFRKPAGYPLGWLAQIAGLALGFLTSIMFVVAGIFLLVYVLAFLLGKKIDRTPLHES